MISPADQGRVEILLSVYNGEKFLPELLTSLLEQNDKCFDLRVRDDGSVDDSLSVLESFSERFSRIEIIKGKNVGWQRSFEILMAKVDSDIVIFADQDDIWYPEKVSVIRDLYRASVAGQDSTSREKKNFAFVHRADICDEAGLTIDTDIVLGRPRFARTFFGSRGGYYGCCFACSSDLLTGIKQDFKDPFRLGHDFPLSVIAKQNRSLIESDRTLIKWRRHTENSSVSASTSPVASLVSNCLTLWGHSDLYADLNAVPPLYRVPFRLTYVLTGLYLIALRWGIKIFCNLSLKYIAGTLRK